MPTDITVPFYISYVAIWILVILQGMVLLGLVRMVYQLQRTGAAIALSKGQEAPAFSALTLAGTPLSSKEFAGRLTGLLFVSTTCSACAEALGDMNYLRFKAKDNVIVICRAGQGECRQLIEKFELNLPVIADEDERISRLYGISSVPMMVLINENNRIQSYGEPKREEAFEAASAEIQEVN